MILEGKQSEFNFVKAFEDAYRQEFGFVLEAKKLVCDDVRVRGIGKSLLSFLLHSVHLSYSCVFHSSIMASIIISFFVAY